MNKQETLEHLEKIAKSVNGKVVERSLSWQEQYILGEGAKEYRVVAYRPQPSSGFANEVITSRIIRKTD